jgi:putative glutamine amidotransferase
MTKPKNERGLSFHAEPGTVSKVSLSAGKQKRWETAEPILTVPRKWFNEIADDERTRRPVIGVNCDLLKQGDTEYCFVPDAYVQCLDAAGAEIVILAPYTGLAVPCSLLDGLVMIGGKDLDPRNDGYQLHPAHRLMHPRREKFDRRLVAEAAREKIPLLAIGAGMQTLNVVLGGTLAYHLPEDFPKSPPHYQNDDPEHGHAVYCRRDSLCEVVYPEVLVGYVRSQHHQAVDEVAPGFVATAWSDYGIIEAIESTTAGWAAIGVQWHPEFETAMVLDRLLFEYFACLCADRKRR